MDAICSAVKQRALDSAQRVVSCLLKLPWCGWGHGVLMVAGWPAAGHVARLGVGERGDLVGLQRLDPALPAPHASISASVSAYALTASTSSSRCWSQA